MKQSFLFIFILLVFACPVSAQSAASQQYAQWIADTLRTRIKKEFKFTRLQIDSVLSIEMDFRTRNSALENDDTSSEDDRNIQLKSLASERRLRLKAVLTDYQITRFEALLDRMKRVFREL